MDIRQNMIENLKLFVIKAREIENYYEILEHIFNYCTQKCDEKLLIEYLNDYISNAFGISGNYLVDYFISDGYVSAADLQLEGAKYNKIIETINKLKRQYGWHIRKASQRNHNPFMINTVGFSVGAKESLHVFKISRADGVTFEAVFNPQVMLTLLPSFIEGTHIAMRDGIFNVNVEVVNNYLKKSKEFNEFLEALIRENQGESHDG